MAGCGPANSAAAYRPCRTSRPAGKLPSRPGRWAARARCALGNWRTGTLESMRNSWEVCEGALAPLPSTLSGEHQVMQAGHVLDDQRVPAPGVAVTLGGDPPDLHLADRVLHRDPPPADPRVAPL